HKLTERVLYPRTLEKMNVKLTNSLFHESTIAALRHYGSEEDKKDWMVTANFLEVIWTWWMIINIRSPQIGFHKRNPWKRAITSNSSQLEYLRDFTSWLNEWEAAGDKASSLT
ncbi:Putative LOC101234561, partial [Caligus rogercresseyi]